MAILRTSSARALTWALVSLIALVNNENAVACYVHTGQYQGLQIENAASIPVSVATRRAILAGEIEDIPRTTRQERIEALKRLAYIVSVFGNISQEKPVHAPTTSFSVFLTESGLWTRFYAEDKSWNVQQHRTSPEPGDTVVVISDPAMMSLLKGEIDPEKATKLGVLHAEGDVASIESSLTAFGHLISAFASSNYANFNLRNMIKAPASFQKTVIIHPL